MDKAKLEDLRKRVEEAQGPDRNLDWSIHTTVTATWNAGADWSDYGFVDVDGQRPAEHEITIRRDGKTYYDYLPPYTGSLDAALELVGEKLPGWEWMLAGPVETDKTGKSYAEIERRGEGCFSTYGATPALTLLSALLAALSALEVSHG